MSVLSVLGAVLLVLLKGIGVLLLVVLILAVVLLFCPFCADVQWENDVLTIRAGALGLTLPVFQYPALEKPKKKKKKNKKEEPKLTLKKKKPAEQKADKKPKPETSPRKKARLTLNILCTILRGAGRLTRAIIGSLRITKIDVVLGVRGEDPAEAARSYGRLNAWLYPALGFLDRFVYLDFEQLRLLPDFGSAQPTVQDRVSFRVSAQAYAIVFTAVRVLYEFWREKVLDVFL